MTSLADSFLKDLEEDGEEVNDQTESEEETDPGTEKLLGAEPGSAKALKEVVRGSGVKSLVVIPDAVREYVDSLSAPKTRISELLDLTEFKTFISLIEKSPETNKVRMETLDKCNNALKEIDEEILKVFRFIRDSYGRRFPELESLVTAPLDYINVVKLLKNELAITQVDLTHSLPNTAIMAVTVAASVTIGKLLPLPLLERIVDATEEVDDLVGCRLLVVHEIESSMHSLAPNLTALAGASLAARLVTHAGSLDQLAKIPSQNILLLGGSSYARSTSAFATGAAGLAAGNSGGRGRGFGVIYQSDIVQTTPPEFRVRAMKLLAGKSGLAVRKDVFNNDGSNALGRSLREYVLTALQRQLKPPPPRLKKSLPVPEERSKPKRGGKRRRHDKEKYGMSELKQKQNRLSMDINANLDIAAMEEEFSD